jgi:hypothetical protein
VGDQRLHTPALLSLVVDALSFHEAFYCNLHCLHSQGYYVHKRYDISTYCMDEHEFRWQVRREVPWWCGSREAVHGSSIERAGGDRHGK